MLHVLYGCLVLEKQALGLLNLILWLSKNGLELKNLALEFSLVHLWSFHLVVLVLGELDLLLHIYGKLLNELFSVVLLFVVLYCHSSRSLSVDVASHPKFLNQSFCGCILDL